MAPRVHYLRDDLRDGLPDEVRARLARTDEHGEAGAGAEAPPPGPGARDVTQESA